MQKINKSNSGKLLIALLSLIIIVLFFNLFYSKSSEGYLKTKIKEINNSANKLHNQNKVIILKNKSLIKVIDSFNLKIKRLDSINYIKINEVSILKKRNNKLKIKRYEIINNINSFDERKLDSSIRKMLQ